MKTYVLVYEGFAHFEVILATYFLKFKGEIITVGLNKDEIISLEGFKIIPHITLEEVNLSDVDVFILPGGEPNKLYDNTYLYDILSNLNEKNIVMAAICAGPIHFAKAGILKGKKYTTSLDVKEHNVFDSSKYIHQNIVVDGNIITAKPTGYVDFAIEIGKVMDIYDGEADLVETMNFFKYFKF